MLIEIVTMFAFINHQVDNIFMLLIQKIATVVEASLEDYEEGMKACSEASKIWMEVSLLFAMI